MKISTRIESHKLARPFVTARGPTHSINLLRVDVEMDGVVGRGESAPQAFMGHLPERDIRWIERLAQRADSGSDHKRLLELLPPGSARNALDCALWDLEAKRKNQKIWSLIGIPQPQGPLTGVMTISVGDPDTMGMRAAELAGYKILKVKLDGELIEERIRAVRKAAPDTRMTVDANEGWTFDQLVAYAPLLDSLGIEFLEQPLPHGRDAQLEHYNAPLPLAADESCHTVRDLDALEGRYDIVNIKLDKTGGLTGALQLARTAADRGFRIMTGCNLATSLAMAPGFVVASLCEYCDLDGPLMLGSDRENGLSYDHGRIFPPGPELWG